MTALFGAVAVFISFILTVWVGELGVYLPLAVWTVFAMGNFFGIRSGIWLAVFAATLSGLTYDRGAAGFLEPFAAAVFWIPVFWKGRRYVFGEAGSWFPGSITGMTAAFILYGSAIAGGGWRYSGAWMSMLANVLFCGMTGIFILPVIMWLTVLCGRKLGLDLARPGAKK